MDSNKSVDSFANYPFSTPSMKSQSIVNVGESDSQASQEAQSYSQQKNPLSILRGFPRKDQTRTKNHILYFKKEVVQTLLNKFKDASSQILSTILKSAQLSTKYTQQPCKKQLTPSEKQRASLIVERFDYWVIRFKQLRPLLKASSYRFRNWEELLLHYYFNLRQFIKVRYILKKMGQGWQTIFVFQKGKDFQVEVPPVDAPAFQKQSFSLELVEKLQYKTSDSPSLNVIEAISRQKHFKLYKEKVMHNLPKSKHFDQDSSPSNKRDFIQMLKSVRKAAQQKSKKVYELSSELAESLHSSFQSVHAEVRKNQSGIIQNEAKNGQIAPKHQITDGIVTTQSPADQSFLISQGIKDKEIRKPVEDMQLEQRNKLDTPKINSPQSKEEDKENLSMQEENKNIPRVKKQKASANLNKYAERKKFGEEGDQGQVIYTCNVKIRGQREKSLLKSVQEVRNKQYRLRFKYTTKCLEMEKQE